MEDILPASPVTVSSQSWLGVPRRLDPLNNIAAGKCTRCGRPTEPGNVWNVCPSCTARSGSAIGGGGGPSSHPSARCAACGILLSVPAYYHTARVLCPPCQARHVAEPRLRANPYPVVPPIAKAIRARGIPSTVAYTYPQPHFAIPSPPAPLPADPAVAREEHLRVTHRPNVLRICMRFGCGARLPEHVLGDMCSTCIDAGFVCPRPPPPPAVLPKKRVPRRRTERTHTRPLGSLENVRVSLLRQAIEGNTVTREEKGIEKELELVYPDDVPIETQQIFTPSESKSEEVKPMEDEDEEVELELLYPEDAAEAVQKALTKPEPKLKPPTSLRELFAARLQTIPTPQNLAPLADKKPPRRCRMAGCNEVLPAQTRMERCVKCSIDGWKRRKLTAVDTFDSSRRPCIVNSPTMDTSLEVMTMLDEISDIEGGHDLPPTSSLGKGSHNEPTGDHDSRQMCGWDSDLTELSSSGSSESELDPEPDPLPTSLHGDATRLTIRIPLLVHRLPPDCLLRKCGNKRCNIALPKDHQWKSCDPCRRAHRAYQQTRLENKRRKVLGMDLLEPPGMPYRRWRSLSPDISQPDVTLMPETSRQCSSKRCPTRIPLPEVYRWKTCIKCRARARRKARRKRDALLEAQRASCPPEVVPRFPAYQNRGVLLSSFDAQIRGFVEGQIMYLRSQLREDEPQKLEDIPMVFVFVGEYSIVTGQRGDRDDYYDDHDDSQLPDDLADLKAMRKEVSSIVSELERALRTTFREGEAFAIDKGGMIMRFTCELQLIAQLRPLTTPTSNSETSAGKIVSGGQTPSPPAQPFTVPLSKTLSGELEAVVVPDESHRLFHGRRTVIRYCMLG